MAAPVPVQSRTAPQLSPSRWRKPDDSSHVFQTLDHQRRSACCPALRLLSCPRTRKPSAPTAPEPDPMIVLPALAASASDADAVVSHLGPTAAAIAWHRAECVHEQLALITILRYALTDLPVDQNLRA